MRVSVAISAAIPVVALSLLASSLCFSTSAWAFKQHDYWAWGNYYRVIEPDDSINYPRRPALVLLHGCKQTAAEILDVTGLAAMADEKGFYVIVPEQNTSRNSDHCWNWFLPQNQTLTSYGEPVFIRDIVSSLMPAHAIDLTKIYLVGMSAGAGMAMNLYALYPDVFAGAVGLAGIPFGIATGVESAMDLITQGPLIAPTEIAARMFRSHPVVIQAKRKILLVHGSSDTRVSPKNSSSLFESFKSYADLGDDGKANKSAQFKNTTRTSPGSFKAYPFVSYRAQSKYYDIELQTITGLAHQWPGSKAASPYSAPKGPGLTETLIKFLEL